MYQDEREIDAEKALARITSKIGEFVQLSDYELLHTSLLIICLSTGQNVDVATIALSSTEDVLIDALTPEQCEAVSSEVNRLNLS
ncbi:hypothetical protein, partial [Pseudomonas shirazensis]